MQVHPQAAGATHKLELAQILARHGTAFRETHALSAVQRRAMRAIENCRSSALGGHIEQCDACGTQRYLYHSCRNRHCPKCQTRAKERWLADRQAELLPVPYYHVVFTLPHTLNALTQGNLRVMLGLLFNSAARTLIEFGQNPRWLGGQIGLTMVLHTWGQNLDQHLHLHCLVSGGALAKDGHWIHPRRGFLFPVKALSMVFRGKFLAGLGQAFERSTLTLAGSTTTLADALERTNLYAALPRGDDAPHRHAGTACAWPAGMNPQRTPAESPFERTTCMRSDPRSSLRRALTPSDPSAIVRTTPNRLSAPIQPAHVSRHPRPDMSRCTSTGLRAPSKSQTTAP